jgi:hypothetical protein
VALGQGLDLAGEGGFVVLADAAESPFGVGHFADEAGFSEVAGGEVLGEFVKEVGIFGEVVAGEEDGLGAETVTEVVTGRNGFAGFGGGAGGEFGVGLVGSYLGGGGHGFWGPFAWRVAEGVKDFGLGDGGWNWGQGFGISGLEIFSGAVTGIFRTALVEEFHAPEVDGWYADYGG